MRETGKRNAQSGYSLIQLVMAVVIVGVLGALGTARLSAFLKEKALQGEIQSLVGMVRETRSQGLKKNVPIGLIFDAARGGSRIYEDQNADGRWQSGEPIRDVALGREMLFGPAYPAPAKGPGGTAVPASGLDGAWASALIFANDPMATPNVGALYLHHARLNGWTACLLRSASSQQLQAYLWDGTAWRLL